MTRECGSEDAGGVRGDSQIFGIGDWVNRTGRGANH